MSDIDPRVASVLDRRSRDHVADDTADNDDDDEDVDAMIASLETDSSLDAYREQRLEQLNAELSREKQLRQSEFGKYTRLKEEKALMDIVKSTKLCVIHFFKPDFARCTIMDRHLERLAEKHFDTRFLGIDVANAPFLVVRLGVQVLPCLLVYIDGACVDRILGFEGLGKGDDHFTTKDLEARLLSSSVLLRAKMGNQYTARKASVKESELDDGDDWD